MHQHATSLSSNVNANVTFCSSSEQWTHALSPNFSTEQKKVKLQDHVSEYVTGSMSCSSSRKILPLSHAHSEALPEALGCHHA